MRYDIPNKEHDKGGKKLKLKRIVLALGFVLLSAIGLGGCGKDRELTRVTADETIPQLQNLEPADDDDSHADFKEDDAPAAAELVALADTLEEAEEIAELYGIELSTYSYGVATYTTDKNTAELMELGEKNGYPALTPNYENELYTEP